MRDDQHEDYATLLTARLAAERIRATPQVIDRWRATGLLKPATDGTPFMYRLGDVLVAESAARNAPRGRRRVLLPAGAALQLPPPSA